MVVSIHYVSASAVSETHTDRTPGGAQHANRWSSGKSVDGEYQQRRTMTHALPAAKAGSVSPEDMR